jgi:hypothetical protein
MTELPDSTPERLGQPPPLDWDAQTRHGARPDTACRLIPLAGARWLPALLLNLSTGGAGLLVDKYFEPGAELAVLLDRRSGTFSYLLRARVVHVREASPGRYVLGAAFPKRLSVEELQAVLHEAQG